MEPWRLESEDWRGVETGVDVAMERPHRPRPQEKPWTHLMMHRQEPKSGRWCGRAQGGVGGVDVLVRRPAGGTKYVVKGGA